MTSYTATTATTGRPSYPNAGARVAERVAALLARMTLDEKIGQMTLVEKISIKPQDVGRHAIGAVLSGGRYPPDNSPAGWLAMVGGYLDAARQTRLGIPLLCGVDAVRGHNSMHGAVIYPHNVGLGAAGDADLVRRIGRNPIIARDLLPDSNSISNRAVAPFSAGWQSTKAGAGSAPIETDEGWLLIYHGVLTSCNGFVYSFGAALLDLEEPWRVRYRGAPYLLSPQTLYECVGDVPNVVFPCAALHDRPTGRLAIYYGAADTVTALAFAYLPELVDFVKRSSAL